MLKASDICNIIKACGENSVSEISFHGVTIKFQSQRNEIASSLGPATDLPDTPVQMSEISKEDTRQAEAFDQAKIVDSEEELLMIDDPVAYEKTQIDQDIERHRGLTQ